jgi:hypothetical protein
MALPQMLPVGGRKARSKSPLRANSGYSPHRWRA